jgi:hypothetical protein
MLDWISSIVGIEDEVEKMYLRLAKSRYPSAPSQPAEASDIIKILIGKCQKFETQ